MAAPFTAAALTRALAHPVTDVHEDARFPATTATVAALTVRFSDDRPALRCVAKHGNAPSLARELRFYRAIAPRWPSPAPALLGAATGDDGILLVLEDVTAHHALAAAITDAHLTAAIDAVIPFHAAFWDDVTAALPFGSSVSEAAQAWPPDAIAAHAAALRAIDFGDLGALLPAWQAQLTRRAHGGRLTLCHGDYHAFGNILFAAHAPPRIIDWSEVKPALPAHDVAYLLHAAPADRAHHEALLAHYHRGLGRADYPWPLCHWDFRCSLLANLFQAVHQRSATWLARNHALVALHDATAVLHEPPPL